MAFSFTYCSCSYYSNIIVNIMHQSANAMYLWSVNDICTFLNTCFQNLDKNFEHFFLFMHLFRGVFFSVPLDSSRTVLYVHTLWRPFKLNKEHKQKAYVDREKKAMKIIRWFRWNTEKTDRKCFVYVRLILRLSDEWPYKNSLEDWS